MTQPAYQRIADDLRRQIIDGTLAPGDRVPSRAQLRERYEVSDQVALGAVRLLTTEGFLEARSGSGTYVRRKPELKRVARSWYGSSLSDATRHVPARPCRCVSVRNGDPSRPLTGSPAVMSSRSATAGDAGPCSRYTFLADEQPVMLSTSWEPLDLTHGTPVMFPEEGPHAGAGVVARMRAIGQHIESVQEVVTARPVLQSEAEPLGEALGAVVMVIQRTYRTAERAVETADIVVPTDRYEVEYVLPVE